MVTTYYHFKIEYHSLFVFFSVFLGKGKARRILFEIPDRLESRLSGEYLSIVPNIVDKSTNRQINNWTKSSLWILSISKLLIFQHIFITITFYLSQRFLFTLRGSWLTNKINNKTYNKNPISFIQWVSVKWFRNNNNIAFYN